MAICNNSLSLRIALGFGLLLPLTGATGSTLAGQTPAVTPAAHQLGTVQSIEGSVVTLKTDAGQSITVTVPAEAKIVKLPAGNTDLKSATASQFADIAVGDRVLATGKAGDTPGALTAVRVVVMKSGDIAEKNAAEQADWKARGGGGIVSMVDAASGTITLTAGTKKIAVTTSSKTAFKRFASDSEKYQDAKPGALAQVRVGDQVQARGVKSADGTSIQAEEVVSGSFRNLSGLIITADPAAKTITLKDLATKKMMTVNLTANSDIRKMPPQVATMFAARTSGGAGQAGGGGGQGGGGQGGGGGRRNAGADLSQMIGRLPASTLADLTKGEAVMIVASEPTPGATTVTAITLLSGVEPILTANPNGGMDLSSWSVGGSGGGGGPE